MAVLLVLVNFLQWEPSIEVSGNAPPLEFDIVFEDGFWNRAGNVTIWENLTILSMGNIFNHGHLTIRNCTMVLDPKPLSRADLQNYNRTWIEDLDGDPGTTGDASVLISRNFNQAGLVESNNQAQLTSIFNSRLEDMFVAGDHLDIKGSEMINVSIMGSLSASSIRDLRMIGNGTGTAIRKGGTSDAEIRNVSIQDYGQAIDAQGGRFSVRGSRISDCRQGIYQLVDELFVGGTQLENCTYPLFSYGLINIVGSSVSGGRIDVPSGSVMNIQESHFIGMDSIGNLTGSVVRGSTFENCRSPLKDPVRSRIILNRFTGNDVAISGPKDCEIYHNSFRDNWKVVEGLTLSTWHNTTLEEGNYYDIYNGLDNGEGGRRALDGIGDTNIPFLGRDPFPLMQDQHWSMPPIPGLDLLYQGGSDEVLLIWNGSGASKYIVQRSVASDFSRDVRSWSLNIPSLLVKDNPNSTLYFRVRSYNKVGSRGWSLPGSVVVDQAPLVPVDIKIEPLPAGGSLAVSWNWEGEDIEKALLFYSSNGVDFKLVQIFHPDSSYLLGGLRNGIRYYIIMMSVDHHGHTSAHSAVFNATPVDIEPPSHPRNLRGMSRGNETIRIEWDPPLVQDIWGYIVYRKGPGEESFKEITRLSKNVLFFEDHGLLDNTSYEYSVSSVDDDGPVSAPSPSISVRTDHFNSRPIFSGVELILYLVEDMGPLRSHILDNFTDPDGDELSFSIIEYFPFPARISDGLLWILPESDQAGEGYVQVSVSDGEESVPFLIGIIVESVEDAPRDVRIISPLNGSVLLPGNPVTLEASGYDPDTGQGDRLNVTWTSDRDGTIFESSQSVLRTLRELSPGIHLITLRVSDRSGNVKMDNVTVIVSLWGWGDMPWEIEVKKNMDMLVDAPFLELLIRNDSPLVLRFSIIGTLDLGAGVNLQERNILVGPRSDGLLTIEFPPGFVAGREYHMDLTIEAQTINGTYGGTSTLSHKFTPISQDDGSQGQAALILVISVISIIAVLGLATYIILNVRKNRENEPDTGEDRKGD
ncbi:MAG: fibronectin type III domain-containing protein [Thermoplasmatota archaeon]